MRKPNVHIPSVVSTACLALMLTACGGDGGGDATTGSTTYPVSNATPLSNPTLLFAAGTGPNSVVTQWVGNGADVSYDVHASTSPDFVPSASTRKATVQAVTSATLDGLAANTQYTLKVVAYRASQAGVTSSNALSVKTMASALQLRPGVVLSSDVVLGLAVAVIGTSTITYNTTSSSHTPAPGSYVTGNQFGDNYLRRIVSTTQTGALLVATTQDVKFQDLYASGSIDYMIGSAPLSPVPAATAAHAARAHDTAADPACKVTTGAGAKLPESLDVGIEPTFHANAGFDANNDPFLDASLAGAWHANLRIDVQLKGTVRFTCSKRIYETPSVGYPFFIGPVPFEASALFAIEIASEVSVSDSLDSSLTAEAHGTISAGVRANRQEGFVVTGSNQPPVVTATPTVNSAAPNLDGKISLKDRFFAEGSLSIGSRKLHLAETVQIVDVGFDGGPEAQVAFRPNMGFIKTLKEYQLSDASLDVAINAFGQLGDDLEDFLSAFLIDKEDLELTGEISRVHYLKLPTLSLAITPNSTGAAAVVSSVGGINLDLDQTKVQWKFTPSIPLTLPTDPSGTYRIAITDMSQGCAAASATDAIFGEVGRRYSNAAGFGSVLTTIDFKSGETTENGTAYRQGPYQVLLPPQNPNPSPTPPVSSNSMIVSTAAGNYVLDTVGFYASISRLDGAPFDLIRFDVGVLDSPGYPLPPPLGVVYADETDASTTLASGMASGSLGSLMLTTFTAGTFGKNLSKANLASKPPVDVPPNIVFPFVFGFTNFVVSSAPACAQ